MQPPDIAPYLRSSASAAPGWPDPWSRCGPSERILGKVVTHNLCVLITIIHELGLDVPAFSRTDTMAG